MKDALGHGSAAHQSGVAALPPFITSRPTGFPVGGHYALDEHGNVLRGNAKEGEMPPRYPTSEKADQVATAVHAAYKGLSGWVSDYKAVRTSGNLKLAKQLRSNIDQVISKHGLDRQRVYGADPDARS
jgi:hypothetical protein